MPAAEFPRALDETIERFLALPPASARASKLLTGRAFDLDLETFRLQMQAHFKVSWTPKNTARPWKSSAPGGDPEG